MRRPIWVCCTKKQRTESPITRRRRAGTHRRPNSITRSRKRITPNYTRWHSLSRRAPYRVRLRLFLVCDRRCVTNRTRRRRPRPLRQENLAHVRLAAHGFISQIVKALFTAARALGVHLVQHCVLFDFGIVVGHRQTQAAFDVLQELGVSRHFEPIAEFFEIHIAPSLKHTDSFGSTCPCPRRMPLLLLTPLHCFFRPQTRILEITDMTTVAGRCS